MSPTPRDATGRRFRPLASGLSGLLLGLQLLGVAHLALERHGVCWEHGTLTEARASERTAPYAVGPASEAGVRAGHSAQRLEDVDAHHHCPVQASRRDWVAPPTPSALACLAGAGPGEASLTGALPFVDGALLLRAPKQSPPLAC
jgi:hypothetical protein